MIDTKWTWVRTLVLLALTCPFLYSSPLLFSISGDTQNGPFQGVPREVNMLSTGADLEADLFDLGDGSLGFSGGLTYRHTDNLFYSIANDGFGNNTLVSFSVNGSGTFSPHSDFLADGFYYGLTYNPSSDVFYALYTQFLGYVTFVEINADSETVTPIFDYAPASPFGLGGMTWGPTGMQGLFTNSQFQFQIFDIDLAGQQLSAVGQGYAGYLVGGFYYDPVSAAYYAIQTDDQANGTLVTLDPTLGAVNQQFAIGQGYYYTNLTGWDTNPGNGTGAVPEPGSWVLISTGAALLAVSKWVRLRS